MPPWAHVTNIDGAVPQERNWFRDAHNLQGKFVVMYSGNHSPANPLDTLLDAAVKLRDDPRVHFAFIGGGMGKPAVDAFIKTNSLTNVLSLH